MNDGISFVRYMPRIKQIVWYLRGAALAASFLLLVVIVLLYRLQPDLFAALTIWPRWVWLAPGIIVGLAGWSRNRKKIGYAVLVFWLLYAIFFVEEPSSLLRFRRQHPQDWQIMRLQGKGLRVISLNCAEAGDAAAEVEAYSPDIVLLQESPSKESVEALAERLFGIDSGVVWSEDASIIVRGTVVPVESDAVGYYVRARALLTSGAEVEIVSLHLHSVPYNFRIWTGQSWISHANHRQTQRQQMQEITEILATVPKDAPIILGGDFNAPPGNGVYHQLRPRLRDSFRAAGKGWGNTILNNMPVVRIDQVWVNDHFQPVLVEAKKTDYTDHRMVICDLLLR